jgi:hypothetical protein
VLGTGDSQVEVTLKRQEMTPSSKPRYNEIEPYSASSARRNNIGGNDLSGINDSSSLHLGGLISDNEMIQNIPSQR